MASAIYALINMVVSNMDYNRFTSKADLYDKFRPKYSEEFIDYIYKYLGISDNTIVADIGAGTGILSEEFLKRGSSVICVEPNKKMLEQAKYKLQQFKKVAFINATAENTSIINSSVNIVTVGQAFHWFDKKAFLKECRRILIENGFVVLAWNISDSNDPINKEIANLILDAGFPHIIIGHPSFESRLCWVDTNHALAGEYAAAHMIACGYTDVAFIGERKTDYISAQRQKGFMAGMLDRGFHIPAARIGNTDSSCQHAYAVTSDMLTQPVPPRAIVCENNTLALGIIQAVKDRQLSIPDDIAILTFDVYPYSSIIDPQLTIVDINVYDTGVQAGSMMIRKLQNPELLIQSYTTLPVIIQGESTRPLT